ncbi:Hsp20/alpha crystallin family protein [Bacillus carboniphilus]|uniref:Hsp20/alpha crystallin family protein n=1 Tax=Bacillus carboniphilus TaxID=86663 RepID=A0ABY9JV35_9BACI|nr:Hsp20/alpha crystallin family protein [Bacillus carboniphilus]WLR42285.1 Hsp20/alpha crystallin family protein [Bacillus carboniphilus]
MENERSRSSSGGPMGMINDFFRQPPKGSLLSQLDNYFMQSTPMRGFPVDKSETDRYFIVSAMLPGVNKEKIDIKVIGDDLVINVKETKTEGTQKLPSGKRTVYLPTHVAKKNMKATYKDGILKIKFPKKSGMEIKIDEAE